MATKVENSEDQIMVRILGEDNYVIKFKIKKTATLRKLMNSYCEKIGIAVDSVRFRFDGLALSTSDTAATLKMVDGDTIEVYQQQSGGF